jgi:hypothetical protein
VANERSIAEADIVARCRAALVASDLASAPLDDISPRAYLDSPFARASRLLGVEPSAASMTDEDVVAANGSDAGRFLDAAEIFTLELAYANFMQVDVRSTDLEHKYDQYGKRLLTLIDRKRKQFEDAYGIGVATPQVGTLDRGFQEPECEEGWLS